MREKKKRKRKSTFAVMMNTVLAGRCIVVLHGGLDGEGKTENGRKWDSSKNRGENSTYLNPSLRTRSASATVKYFARATRLYQCPSQITVFNAQSYDDSQCGTNKSTIQQMDKGNVLTACHAPPIADHSKRNAIPRHRNGLGNQTPKRRV